MSKRRIIGKTIGAAVAVFGTLLMIGIGGAVESGTLSATSAFIRMIIGCVAIWSGAAIFGGIE